MKVAFAIKSCHKYEDRRQAQRETWLPTLPANFFFLIGDPAPATGRDFLYCCGASDAFADIAPKVLAAVEHALGDNVTNLCVLDDDTYVVPSRMLKCGFQHFDYLGFVRNYGFTPYMQGSCYWLSERSMERIMKNRVYLTPGVPDDVAVGKALYGEVPFTHEHRFAIGDPYPEPGRCPRPENNIISCHKMNPASMRACHRSLIL